MAKKAPGFSQNHRGLAFSDNDSVWEARRNYEAWIIATRKHSVGPFAAHFQKRVCYTRFPSRMRSDHLVERETGLGD